MQPDLTNFQSYFLVIPHPDDEVNCGVLLHRLISQGKAVTVVLLTNGDAGQNSAGRAGEMRESASAIGLKQANLITLGISEKELLRDMSMAFEQTLTAATKAKPECILSLDFEGGHEGHDSASVIAHVISLKLGLPHIVFPDYHFRNLQRHGLEFIEGRESNYVLDLTDQEKDLKIKLLEAHRGQIGFFLRMQKNQDNYFRLLFEREIYRLFPERYDFLTRPSYQIGYEYHRNGFKFSDFVAAARQVPGLVTRQ